MEPVGAGAGGGSDPGLINGFVDRLLLCNTLPTGAILFVLITVMGPISGAHFNPAVTLVFGLRRQISVKSATLYVFMQFGGAILGTWLAHAMFDMPLSQLSDKVRAGSSQWI